MEGNTKMFRRNLSCLTHAAQRKVTQLTLQVRRHRTGIYTKVNANEIEGSS